MSQILDNIDSFIKHFKETKNVSLIARIYGVFSFALPNQPPINFLIMQNVARVRNTEEKLYEFDLKGSSIDRYVTHESTENPKLVLNVMDENLFHGLDFSQERHTSN